MSEDNKKDEKKEETKKFSVKLSDIQKGFEGNKKTVNTVYVINEHVEDDRDFTDKAVDKGLEFLKEIAWDGAKIAVLLGAGYGISRLASSDESSDIAA